MAVYAIYSYEIQEGGKSLFYKDTGTKAIDMANEIIGNLLNDGLTVVGQKRKQDLTLTNLNFKGADGVFSWELCNEKDKTLREGHEKRPVSEHPGSYVIVDNRPDVCQIAIERNDAFDSDTDKVAKYLKRALGTHLHDYGLQIVIKRKYQAGKFKEQVRKRIVEKNDAVRKVVWEFPNPKRVKGIDATEQMKNRLQGLMIFTEASNALKGKLTLTGSKGYVMDVDDDKIDDWADMIALSAQNHYKLSYYFYNSPMINFKDVAYATATAARGGHGKAGKRHEPHRRNTQPKLSTLQKRKAMKKETWKYIIQTIIAILTAILTTLGVASCMGHGPL